MKHRSTKIGRLVTLITCLLAVLSPTTSTASGETEGQVCNVAADYMLGRENYPEAIRLHQRFVAHHPDDALAHYHLGFAYGMIGHTRDEIQEYLMAANLRLTNWDLFLNLGLAYFEQGNSAASIDAFKKAVLHGPAQSETHFNLGIAYERTGRLTAALQEITAALNLNSTDPEVQNMLAAIEAELGDFRGARNEWSDLLRARPDYEPARHNLVTLDAMLFNELRKSTRFPGADKSSQATATESYRRFTRVTDH